MSFIAKKRGEISLDESKNKFNEATAVTEVNVNKSLQESLISFW